MSILTFGRGERRYETDPAFRTRLSEWLGRPSGQLAGTFVCEMADLRKMLYLCDSCSRRFRDRKFGYRRAARPPLNQGCITSCDGCRVMGDCHFHIPEERY